MTSKTRHIVIGAILVVIIFFGFHWRQNSQLFKEQSPPAMAGPDSCTAGAGSASGADCADPWLTGASLNAHHLPLLNGEFQGEVIYSGAGTEWRTPVLLTLSSSIHGQQVEGNYQLKINQKNKGGEIKPLSVSGNFEHLHLAKGEKGDVFWLELPEGLGRWELRPDPTTKGFTGNSYQQDEKKQWQKNGSLSLLRYNMKQ